MGKLKKEKKSTYKKEVAADLVTRMNMQFADLKEMIGEKKFGSRLKKAAKMLTAGIKNKVTVNSNSAKRVSKKPVPATA